MAADPEAVGPEPLSSTPPSTKGEDDAPSTTQVGTGSSAGGSPALAGFHIDVNDALTPDPRTEDMFVVRDNKFAYSPGQLSKLLNPKSLNAFYALGGLAGLQKGLRTNIDSGLSQDESTLDGGVAFEDVAPKGTPKYGANGNTVPVPKDSNSASVPPPPERIEAGSAFADRKRVFRDNRLPEKKSKTLLQLAWITYNDKVLILLTIAAIVSLALGLYQTLGVVHGPDDGAKVEWVEGVAIMAAIAIVVVVGTLNDWQMERQFNKLNEKHNDRTAKVIRSGKSVEISVFDIMVGDVMHLFAGDLVPVDGIFINGHGVKCDESSATGESDLLKKVAGQEVFAALDEVAKGGAARPDIEKLDPFIISGSKINEGTGTFLVTAVGVNSSYGRITMALHTPQEDTPLQTKLNGLADMIAKVGGSAALVLFIVLFIKFLAGLPNNHENPDQKGQTFLRIFITAVTVVVVAVPEGLPLAVTLALAFATTRMMKDNNLVRVLKACETMGNATTICSDKTGTLTQNKMTVVATTLGKSISFGGTDAPLDDEAPKLGETSNGAATVPNVSITEFVKSLSDTFKRLLVQSNSVNSTAFEGDVEGEHTFIGSKTEVALLTLCRDNLGSAPVQEERTNANVVQVVPFDSAVKYMATVVKLPNGKFRAYVKGASEILLAKCSKLVTEPSSDELNTAPLTDDDREMLLQTITSYAGQTLRTIGSSYRDFESWPPPELAGSGELTAAEFNKVHEDMTLVAIFGIKDPLRTTVKDAIKDCQRAGVYVRMVTGDNLLTGRAIARECGIYRPEDGGIAMEGPVFRRKTEEELKELVPHLQVLARSSPEDKRILVRILKELGETVAVTGDGTNDAPALKMADIGFAMGIAGTEVAKEAAAIILMDDNFASIVKGISWGRAVNDAVKKFLQFQLTVNVTAVVLTFISAVANGEGESVLNAVQLLWVNLIMDTFAALALATDPPTASILDRKPDRKSAPLITVRMTKMIVGQAICQLVITLVLNFAGPSLLGYNMSNEGEAMHLTTLVFNTFVWLQIFNELNNRRLDNKLNIFEGITKNYIFLVINLIMIGGQVLIIFVGGQAFKITPLNGKEWGLSIGLGAISIPFGALIRLTPDSWAEACIPELAWLKRWNAKRDEKKQLKKDKKKAEKQARDAEKRRTLEDAERASSSSDDSFVAPTPLRALTSLRGKRVETHIRRGFREYMHDKKASVKHKSHKIVPGSKTDVRGGSLKKPT
ncbi:hypothetical protein B0T24DRAFT_618307 [Lasiosphaeria ovina]|uniref:Calcium-transporting ATPase n=1 Tax=Lasiosphaeria ovina TaxID=92902 RepID=A0AAE0KGS3_9PEZI|nr:hypothetical protein B0T24DRAFT_618307 [Lasiosphaeria ovina]